MAGLVEEGHKRREPLIFDYQPSDLTPFAISRQTALLLESVGQRLIVGQTARGYLHDVTLPLYLRRAKQGSPILYSDEALRANDIDPEIQMVARHAFVVFAWMPDQTQWKFVPGGFSRRGMLAAPQSEEAFNTRIDQIETYLSVVSMKQESAQPLGNLTTLRTIAFFHTAGTLSFSFSTENTETAKQQRETLATILERADYARQLANLTKIYGDIRTEL